MYSGMFYPSEKVPYIKRLIGNYSPEHAEEFGRWADEIGYKGGRTAWFASDGTQYDLGGPSTAVYRPGDWFNKTVTVEEIVDAINQSEGRDV